MNFSEFWNVIRVMLASGAMIGLAVLFGMCSLTWGYFAHRTGTSLVAYRIVTILLTGPTLMSLALALLDVRPDALLDRAEGAGLVVVVWGFWLGSPALGWLAGYAVSFGLNLVVPQK